MSDFTKPKLDLKKLRSQLNGVAGVIFSLNGGNKTREISLAYTETQKAKMWVGMILEGIGDESPYKNDGKRKSIADIEPQAESDLWTIKACDTEIEAIDLIREWLNSIRENLVELSIIQYANVHDYKLMFMSFDKTLASIIEARMWLGQELHRIREEAENNG